MGYFFLKCSLSGINLEMYDQLVFSISLGLPVDYCSKGIKSYTEIISCAVQNVTEHSLFQMSFKQKTIGCSSTI